MKVVFMSSLTVLACLITAMVSITFATYSLDREKVISNLNLQIDEMSSDIHKLSDENAALRSKSMNLQADKDRLLNHIQNNNDLGCPD